MREIGNQKHNFPENLANNVLSQTEDKEELFSTNQIASKVIETLIGFAATETFEKYQEVFSQDIRAYSQDKFSSHVLQKMIYLSALRVHSAPSEDPELDLLDERNYNLTMKVPEAHKIKCKEFVTKVSKFLLNNLEELVTDQYANHVIRSCLGSLAGIQYEDVTGKVSQGEQLKNSPITEDWKEIVEEFANRLRVWPQFLDFPYEGLSSGLLQSLVCVLRVVNKDLLKSIGSLLLSESLSKPHDTHATKLRAFSTDFSIRSDLLHSPAQLRTNPIHFRFLETLISVAGNKLFSKIVCSLFIGHAKQLSELKCANFAVQKIFDHVKEKSEFELLFDEVQDSFESILKVGHTGVILAICRTCERLNSKQMPFIKCLKTALKITAGNPHDLIVAIVKLKPIELCQDSNNFIHIHGSVIMQTLLRFQKPIEIISALIGCDNEKLVPLLMTTKGSYIVDAFFQAPFVGEKSKIKFIRKFEVSCLFILEWIATLKLFFQGYYLDLAMNKFGSRILEVIYNAADMTQRTKIVQELSEKLNQLESVHCGFIISKKFNVAVYKQNPGRWQSKRSQNTAQKLFKGII